ncbi:MAG: magnesium transporter [Anaerolineales bacterium]|nr:magnesium transporter [Anaerolineales bacterium]
MDQIILEDVLEQLRTALEANDLVTASSIIEELRPADQADLFWELDEDEQAALLPELNPADAADILEELYDQDVVELAENLPLDKLIEIVNEMEPDEAADLLDDLEPEQAQAVLAKLKEAIEVKSLADYEDDTAGGLMTSAYIPLWRRMTAQQAIDAIRAWRPDEETIYYLFVTDRLKRLVGLVNLRQLIVADPATPITEIMDTDVVYVYTDTDQEECADLMQRYDLLALPVVDENKVLLGIITIDDLVDVIQSEAGEDIQRMGGAEPLDRGYLDTSILAITRKRIGWLLLLFITATLTGLVMDSFQDELAAMVALGIFIPMLIGTGGNAGSQTTATIIHAMAIGDVDWNDAWYVWLHEMRIGIILGLGMGVVAYGLAMFWVKDHRLAMTVAASIFGIVLWATGAGSLLPLLAARLGIDPTVVSGPVMSTMVDATGLFIYFTVARFILGL